MHLVQWGQDHLPDAIKELWNDAKNHPSGQRARETELLNEAFSKVGNTSRFHLTAHNIKEQSYVLVCVWSNILQAHMMCYVAVALCRRL